MVSLAGPQAGTFGLWARAGSRAIIWDIAEHENFGQG